MKIKVSNVNTPNWKDVNVKSHVPRPPNVTFGGLGTMKLLNCLKTLTLLCGKKLVITPSFCWKE